MSSSLEQITEHMMERRRDWALPTWGEQFGRLMVTGYERRVRSDGRVRTYIKVRCQCGTRKVVQLYNLRSGDTTSCGCWHRQRAAEANTTHGGKRTHARLYRIWKAMRERCSSPNAQNYQWYGGKGIRVCARWEGSFEKFRDWSLANGYADDLQLDRRNTSRNYTPGNCQWIPKSENLLRKGNWMPLVLEDRVRDYARMNNQTMQEVIVDALQAFLG